MPLNSTNNKYADVPIRIRSWLAIISVFALAIFHPYTMVLWIVWISFQGLTELGSLFSFKVTYWRIIVPLLQGAFLIKFSSYHHYVWSAFAFIGGVGFLLALIRKWNIGILFSLLIVLVAYPHLFFIRITPQGGLWIIFLVVSTELNDVFQYLCGKRFGKRKILPKISPNKTIEGFVGGLLLTPLLSIALVLLLGLHIPLVTTIFIGLAIGFFGFWGDVFFSYLKRRAGVKDTGNLIPGHGGLLDRIDSLLFNCIWFFLWIR